MSYTLSVAVLTPAHSGLAWRGDAVHRSGLLSYLSPTPCPRGSLVRVPLGSRDTLGVVWRADVETSADTDTDTGVEVESNYQLRPILCTFDALSPLSDAWLNLVEFAASYYHRSVGEVALNALPPALKTLTPAQCVKKLKALASFHADTEPVPPVERWPSTVNLTPEQTTVLGEIERQSGPFLLFGATGSGKTEVYLQAVHLALQSDPAAQVLILVPEINLTPQLEARFVARFSPLYGARAVVSLHSGLTPAQRLNHWLLAHMGGANNDARIILGTRTAIFASIPGLRLIVVDEEHDPSYKSQDVARYSARDLAVYRGHQERAKVILGSATPSLESWRHAEAAPTPAPPLAPLPRSRYQRLEMPSRVASAALPQVRLVDMTQQPAKTLFAPQLLEAMTRRIALGEQCMILLNRRGYAPVLHCSACGWKSGCPHCSAHRVFHKIDRTLRCHHCGLAERVPKACPDCGNVDITTMGRGTEQIEEQLSHLLADVQRPDGTPARVLRIDADSTRQKGELTKQLSEVHDGVVDVLVGTQMIAKGHDFRRITLVAAINPDGALFSADFRAPERMFALLMQAAGRAGRDSLRSAGAQMWIQTHFPAHPLFTALKQHNYPGFAAQELQEREQAAMPPFSFQALIRADARTQEAAQAYLQEVSANAHALPCADQVTRYPCVPLTIARVANVERAQMLVESHSRPALHQFLNAWQPTLHTVRGQHKALIRWAIDVDPQLI